jgi:hypothetical protein
LPPGRFIFAQKSIHFSFDIQRITTTLPPSPTMSDSDEIDSIDSAEVVQKAKRKKRKKNKDPNRPKRNMSAFFLYSNANRARVKADNPDAKFGDIVSLIFEFCLNCADTRAALGVTVSSPC